MKTYLKEILAAALMAATVTACTAHVDGGDAAPVATQKSEPSIEGPNLTGVWSSDCEPDLYSNGYAKTTMVIKDKQVSRTSERFTDYLCQQRTNVDTKNGQFLFKEKYAKEIYKVQYTFKMPQYDLIKTENVRLEGKVLWISEFIQGTDLEPTTKLTLVGAE